MAVSALVSLEEYLSTSYSPDYDYVEGRLAERNAGEFSHSFLQFAVPTALSALGLRVYPELRCQVKADRFRVADVLVLAPGQKRERRYHDDYLAMDIPNIWVVDPDAHTLTVHHSREAHTFTDRVTTSDGAISLDLLDIFRRMSEDEAE